MTCSKIPNIQRAKPSMARLRLLAPPLLAIRVAWLRAGATPVAVHSFSSLASFVSPAAPAQRAAATRAGGSGGDGDSSRNARDNSKMRLVLSASCGAIGMAYMERISRLAPTPLLLLQVDRRAARTGRPCHIPRLHSGGSPKQQSRGAYLRLILLLYAPLLRRLVQRKTHSVADRAYGTYKSYPFHPPRLPILRIHPRELIKHGWRRVRRSRRSFISSPLWTP